MKLLSPTLLKLVEILNDGQTHAGSDLGAKLNITRSAVWKLIKKLVAYDVNIVTQKSRGYALQENLILLNAAEIKSQLKLEQLKLSLYESIASTHDYLKSTLPTDENSVCLAEYQSHGRGRFNRRWVSPFGKNIYLSYHHKFATDVSDLGGLSLVVALATLDTLRAYPLSKPLLIKWPNDIVCEGKKLAGVLIELQAESNGTTHAIIGLGINVNLLSIEKLVIDVPWTSLREISGEYINRNILVPILINNLSQYLQRFAEKGFNEFMDEWKAADYLSGKEIILQRAYEKQQGKVLGIDASGHILLKNKASDVFAYSSGDTSVV